MSTRNTRCCPKCAAHALEWLETAQSQHYCCNRCGYCFLPRYFSENGLPLPDKVSKRADLFGQLPPDLSPLVTDHPASCAYRVESVHVSIRHWTPEQAEAMARALVARDRELYALRQLVWDLSHNDPWEPPQPAKFDRCPHCHRLTQVTIKPTRPRLFFPVERT